MFWKPDPVNEELDRVIHELETDMASREGDSEEYATMLNRLERLYKLKEKNSPRRWSPDTLLLVGGNLAGILIIVLHERVNVITSKAMSYAGKIR